MVGKSSRTRAWRPMKAKGHPARPDLVHALHHHKPFNAEPVPRWERAHSDSKPRVRWLSSYHYKLFFFHRSSLSPAAPSPSSSWWPPSAPRHGSRHTDGEKVFLHNAFQREPQHLYPLTQTLNQDAQEHTAQVRDH